MAGNDLLYRFNNKIFLYIFLDNFHVRPSVKTIFYLEYPRRYDAKIIIKYLAKAWSREKYETAKTCCILYDIRSVIIPITYLAIVWEVPTSHVYTVMKFDTK